MAFGPFGPGQSLGARVFEGVDTARGIRVGPLHPVIGVGAGGGQVGGCAPAGLGEFGANTVEFGAQPLQFRTHLLGRLGTLGRRPFGAFQGALGIGRPLRRQIAIRGRGLHLLGTFTFGARDIGLRRPARTFDIVGARRPDPLDLLGGFLPGRPNILVGRAARREDIVGGAGGDGFDLTHRVLAGGFGRRHPGLCFGDPGIRGFRGGHRVIGGLLGAQPGVVRCAAGLFGCRGGHLGFGDPVGRIRLDCLNLRFGRGRVGEGGHFSDGGVEGGAELFGQAAELGE